MVYQYSKKGGLHLCYINIIVRRPKIFGFFSIEICKRSCSCKNSRNLQQLKTNNIEVIAEIWGALVDIWKMYCFTFNGNVQSYTISFPSEYFMGFIQLYFPHREMVNPLLNKMIYRINVKEQFYILE